MIRALVTRPAEDAAEITRALESRGISVLVEPLLTIRPKDGATVDLAGVQALLFTSANGARAFAKASTGRDLPVFAVGDGTADTLRGLGFAQVESAGGNVEDLERLARIRLDPANGKILHPAGASVAGDLAARLTEAGYQVERVALYDAEPSPELSEKAKAELAAGRIDWVLVFSPRTAAAFASVVERAGLTQAARAMTLVALSDAVAKAASLPFRHIAIAAQPNQAALLTAIDGLMQTQDPTIETPPPADPATTPRRSPTLLLVFAGVIAVAVVLAVVGFSRSPVPNASAPIAAAPVAAPSAPIAASPAATPAAPASSAAYLVPLAQRIDKVDAATAALGQRLDGIAAEVQRVGAQPRSGDAPAAPPVDLAPLEKRLAAVEQSLAELSRRPTATAELEPRLTAIDQSLSDLSRHAAATAELEKRLAEFERLTRADRRLDAAALAALKLGDALNAGRPYKAELAMLAGVPAIEAETKILSARAEAGVPTRAVLAERFQAAAAAASRAADPGGDLWSQALAKLKGLVSIRRLQPGDDFDGRLARAELALGRGDLAAALAALDGLPEGATRALASWRAEAEARLEAERALDRATQALAAGLARAG